MKYVCEAIKINGANGRVWPSLFRHHDVENSPSLGPKKFKYNQINVCVYRAHSLRLWINQKLNWKAIIRYLSSWQPLSRIIFHQTINKCNFSGRCTRGKNILPTFTFAMWKTVAKLSQSAIYRYINIYIRDSGQTSIRLYNNFLCYV